MPRAAVCILGSARSFVEPAVMEALERNFYRRLGLSHHVESFVILDQGDVGIPNIYEAIGRTKAPVFVLFLNNTLPFPAAGKGFQRLNQFQRFRLCRAQVLAQEATRTMRYEWIVRTRPDLFFDEPLPLLSELSTAGISGRLASVVAPTGLPNAAITLVFQGSFGGLGVTPVNGACRKWGWSRETMLDDQFAIVPRDFLDAYFDVDCHFARTLDTKREAASLAARATRGPRLNATDCRAGLGVLLRTQCNRVADLLAERCLCITMAEAGAPIHPVALGYQLLRPMSWKKPKGVPAPALPKRKSPPPLAHRKPLNSGYRT